MSLLVDVVQHLERHDIRAALIGAEALTMYGIVRATVDVDLLTVSQAVLSRDFWNALEGQVSIDVRRGDLDDPLAGVVRLKSTDGDLLDVVVGKYKFESAVLERAERREYEGISLPIVRLPDLVLLKLFAGGAKDAWDIQQVLDQATPDLLAEIEQHLPQLPEDARVLWSRIRAERA